MSVEDGGSPRCTPVTRSSRSASTLFPAVLKSCSKAGTPSNLGIGNETVRRWSRVCDGVSPQHNTSQWPIQMGPDTWLPHSLDPLAKEP